MDEKPCSKCGLLKSTEDWYFHRGRRTYPCKDCKKQYRSEHKSQNKICRDNWRARNKEHIKRYKRNADLMAKYGITADEYDSMLCRQSGRCAICNSPPSFKKLAVDHDHNTGRIRGLLCQHCNTATGSFWDNPNLLRMAADYLERQAY